MKGKRDPDCHIDLGLAISALTLKYGETRTYREMAAYCGCSWQAIYNIEQKTLRKLRRTIYMRKDPELTEFIEDFRSRSKSRRIAVPSV